MNAVAVKASTTCKKFLQKSYTRLYILQLQFKGKKIKVGKETIFSYGARINPGKGMIMIGDKCFVDTGAVLSTQSGKICLGNKIFVGENSRLYGDGTIYIGSDTLIAQDVSILSANHNFNKRDVLIRLQGIAKGKVKIGKDCWIGLGVKILPNVHVSKGSVIGTSAIVTKNTDAYGVYVGNPARKIKDRAE